MSKAQAEALVELLVDAFDSILTTMLPDRYDSYDRRKIALGMVAIMASQKRSSSAFDSDSVGSTIIVPATGKLTVGAWNP